MKSPPSASIRRTRAVASAVGCWTSCSTSLRAESCIWRFALTTRRRSRCIAAWDSPKWACAGGITGSAAPMRTPCDGRRFRSDARRRRSTGQCDPKRAGEVAPMTVVLAIETSCDETGVGIARLDADGTVTLLADEVASSVDEHIRYGGVVPEVASRAHLEALEPAMRRALATAGLTKPDIVAATIGPGLAGALLVGVAAAKAYSAAWDVPFYAVNHLGGHLAADVYEHGPLPESVALLVSGGHTHLLQVRSLGEPIIELGSTVDDAAGEAYDKVARLLGLGYPGGKVLDDLAQTC